MGPVPVKVNKIIIILLIAFTVLGSTFYTTWSAEKDIVLNFQDQLFSASLSGVPLMLILEELGRKKGIWFRGNSSLFEEEITVQFTSLSLEDKVKRILSSMNYSLLFNLDGELDGVIIIGRAKSAVAKSESRVVGPVRNTSLASPNDHGSIIGAFETVRDNQPPGGIVVITDKDLESFKVMRDVPPPGGSVEVTAEERENFTVIRNCPPPGS